VGFLRVLWFPPTGKVVGLHRIVIFTIRPDTGFAGYLGKNPATDSLFNLKAGMLLERIKFILFVRFLY
jgi:hypothetical protein